METSSSKVLKAQDDNKHIYIYIQSKTSKETELKVCPFFQNSCVLFPVGVVRTSHGERSERPSGRLLSEELVVWEELDYSHYRWGHSLPLVLFQPPPYLAEKCQTIALTISEH